MGSRTRRLRAKPKERALLTEKAHGLYWDAARNRRHVPRCCGDPNVTSERVLVAGWSFILTIERHASDATSDRNTDCIHFSAQLHPPGRGSTKRDWENLGYFVSQIEAAGGAKNVQPLTPLESTHPNRVFHWHWHSDGSPIPERVLGNMLAVLQKD